MTRYKHVIPFLVAAALLAGCESDLPRVDIENLPKTSSTPTSPTVSSPSPKDDSPTSPEKYPSPSTSPNEKSAAQVTSVIDFRDVAGNGKIGMKTGVVYRSAQLDTLSPADIQALADLGISDIFDLRASQAAKDAPDPQIGQADYVLINLYAKSGAPKAPTSNKSSAQTFAQGQMQLFVSNYGRRQAMASLLKSISAAKGPVIIHDAEGKDATAWASAVLQLAAGASESQIVANYLLSNDSREEVIADRYEADKSAQGTSYADARRAIAEVQGSYIEAGLAEMVKRYGGIDGYLRDSLGLNTSTVTALRAKLAGATLN